MSNKMPWVVVDWRPFKLPEVYGSFATKDVAQQYRDELFPNVPDEDGILVTQIIQPDFDIPQGVFTDG